MIILLILSYDPIFKILNGKKDSVLNYSSRHGKIVLILLNEIIAIYVKPTFRNIEGPGLQVFLSRLFGVFLSTRGSYL